MAEIKNREKTPLNEYMVKIINGTRYKVYSIYTGDIDFQYLYKNLIIEKAVRQQNGHCNDAGDAV